MDIFWNHTMENSMVHQPEGGGGLRILNAIAHYILLKGN